VDWGCVEKKRFHAKALRRKEDCRARYTARVIIRTQQFDALSRAMISAFEERMVTMVKLRYPQKTRERTDLELRAIIHDGVTRAGNYGIDLTGDVERFIRLTFRMRTFRFEEDPATGWTKEVLRDTSLTSEAKLDQVEGRASIAQLIEEETD
jgi:hypothetical protein